MNLVELFERAEKEKMVHLSIGWTGEDYNILMREEHDEIATSFRLKTIEEVLTWCGEWLYQTPEGEDDDEDEDFI